MLDIKFRKSNMQHDASALQSMQALILLQCEYSIK